VWLFLKKTERGASRPVPRASPEDFNKLRRLRFTDIQAYPFDAVAWIDENAIAPIQAEAAQQCIANCS